MMALETEYRVPTVAVHVDVFSRLVASVAKAKEEEKKGGRAGRGGHESLVHKKSTVKEKSPRKKAS